MAIAGLEPSEQIFMNEVRRRARLSNRGHVNIEEARAAVNMDVPGASRAVKKLEAAGFLQKVSLGIVQVLDFSE